MSNTSERLKKVISEKGVKQVELIERTGISKGALSSYISGRYEPKQDNLYRLAKALDVNPAWLMGLDVPMEPAATSSPAAPANSLRKDEQDLLLEYNSLNTDGRKELERYLAYIASISEFKKLNREN